jgi:flap endonuclease-1
VDLSKLVSKRAISLDELANKTVAIDAYNVLYQFLTTIRQQDGSPLMDANGNITSHLSGLFYRTIDLIEHGVRPVYVFDGIPSILKQKALAARMRRRTDAYAAWQEAVKEGDMEKARASAQKSTTVNKEIVRSARELLDSMGIYCISAPSEGEAQASVMCREGVVDVVASQDYDTLLLGAPLVARNVTVSGRRKLPGKNIYIDVSPELVDLNETLRQLDVSQEQLVWMGLMLGTDFNDGIKGIGPKNALRIAKAAKSVDDMEKVVKERYKSEFEVDVHEVIGLFEKPEVKSVTGGEIEKGLKMKPDYERMIKFMCDDHGFSRERIGKHAERLVSLRGSARQQGMDSWLS